MLSIKVLWLWPFPLPNFISSHFFLFFLPVFFEGGRGPTGKRLSIKVLWLWPFPLPIFLSVKSEDYNVIIICSFLHYVLHVTSFQGPIPEVGLLESTTSGSILGYITVLNLLLRKLNFSGKGRHACHRNTLRQFVKCQFLMLN